MTPTLADAARSWVGTPFQWCASEKGAGCDCAGLVVGCLHECGLTDWRPANYSEEFDLQILLAPLNRFCRRVWHEPLPGRSTPPAVEAGDLLLFSILRRPQHLGIATGAGRFIHAYQTVGRVVETELDRSWRNRLMSVYRWKGVS